MRVKLRPMAGFRHILGGEREIDLDMGSTVGDLLNLLCKADASLRSRLFEGHKPEELRLKEDVNILVSGKNIESLQGLKTELQDGDEVVLFPAAIGG